MGATTSITEGHPAQAPGLARYAAALIRPRAHVITPASGLESAVFAAATHGAWQVGPYAGELRLDGTTLALRPRMGWEALTGWVEAATGLSADGLEASSPTAALTALVWARAVDGATRHGPPAFRRDVSYVGAGVRGHVDVRTTVRMRARGSSDAASVYRSRDLDNPVTRIIVAADRVLTRQVKGARWRTDRVEQVLPQLYVAVGRRAAAPGEGTLARMRYTPITRPFKWAAELSRRIVRQDSVVTAPEPGRVQGVVIDLEAIVRAAILNWARDVRPDLRGGLEAGRVVLRRGGDVHVSLWPELPMGTEGMIAFAEAADGRREKLLLPRESSAAQADVGRLLRSVAVAA